MLLSSPPIKGTGVMSVYEMQYSQNMIGNLYFEYFFYKKFWCIATSNYLIPSKVIDLSLVRCLKILK